jgi:hypothetical protein
MAVVTKQMNDLAGIMYGHKADGFLYEFAAMRESIRSIPAIAQSLKDIGASVSSIDEKVSTVMPKVEKFEKYILRERVRRGLLVALVSGLVSVVTFAITIKTGLAEFFRGH